MCINLSLNIFTVVYFISIWVKLMRVVRGVGEDLFLGVSCLQFLIMVRAKKVGFVYLFPYF